MYNKLKLSMVSSLPPNGGVSDYTESLLSIFESIDLLLDVYTFTELYPKWLQKPVKNEFKKGCFGSGIRVFRTLSWWNIFQAMLLPYRVSSRCINVQYWSPATLHIYFFIILFAKLFHKKIILTVHNTKQHESIWKASKFSILNSFVSIIMKGLARFIIKYSDYYVVHNDKARADMENMGVNGKCVFVVEHPILDLYRKTQSSKVDSLKQLGLPKDKKVLLVFGNVRRYKGVDLIINMFSRLNTEKYYLVIAGRVWKETYDDVYAKLRKLDKNSYTIIDRFLNSSEISHLFNVADILLLGHQDFNSASGVLNVAISFGTRVIASGAFEDELGVDLVKDISLVTNDDIEEVLNCDQSYKQLLIVEKNTKIGFDYLKLLTKLCLSGG